jgi:hypothetical protein
MISKRTTPYTKLIVDATGCTRDQAYYVEDIMRGRWRVLDGLHLEEFIEEAKLAFEVFKDSSIQELYGLGGAQ